MADNADMAADIVSEVVTIAAINARAPIPAGASGDCDECEWWMPRLVGGLCAFCRDGRARPADWEPPTPPTTELAPPTTKEITMPSKSICLPASAPLAIEAVEARAKALGEPLGVAAADLIIAGAQTIDAERAAPRELTFVTVISDLNQLFDDLVGRAARPDQSAELAALTARAEEAETKLATIRSAMG